MNTGTLNIIEIFRQTLEKTAKTKRNLQTCAPHSKDRQKRDLQTFPPHNPSLQDARIPLIADQLGLVPRNIALTRLNCF